MGFGTFFFVGLLFTMVFLHTTEKLDFYKKCGYLAKIFWSFVLILIYFGLFAMLVGAILIAAVPGVKEGFLGSFY